jgi:hypothetical protein
MATTFVEAVDRAVPVEKAALRTLQIWQILISKASFSSLV